MQFPDTRTAKAGGDGRDVTGALWVAMPAARSIGWYFGVDATLGFARGILDGLL